MYSIGDKVITKDGVYGVINGYLTDTDGVYDVVFIDDTHEYHDGESLQTLR